MVYQLMFAIITPALISGAFAERMKFSAMLWFIGLWAIFVYAPIAHWVWEPTGWLAERGILDFYRSQVVAYEEDARIPLIGIHRLAGQRLHGHRRDELGRGRGHYHVYRNAFLDQQARQLGGPVGVHFVASHSNIVRAV